MLNLSDELFDKDQKPLRSRLIKVMKHSHQSLKEIAGEIGITRDTMMKFIHGKNTTFACCSKIELYCVKYEKILDLI
jgi:predicted transcriptional regulator